MSKPVIDTRIAIWDVEYYCSMHFSTSRSVEEIKTYGTPSSGDEEFDREMLNTRVYRYLNIDKMVERIKAGLDLQVEDQADSVPIYKACRAHLEAWQYEITYYHGRDYAPYEDLIAMDRLAMMMYQYSKHLSRSNLLSELGEFFSAEAGSLGLDGWKDKSKKTVLSSPNASIFDDLERSSLPGAGKGKAGTPLTGDQIIDDLMQPNRINLGSALRRKG